METIDMLSAATRHTIHYFINNPVYLILCCIYVVVSLLWFYFMKTISSNISDQEIRDKIKIDEEKVIPIFLRGVLSISAKVMETIRIKNAEWIHMILLGLICWSVKVMGKDRVANANAYVDATLHNLRKVSNILQFLDPLNIPEIDLCICSVRNLKIKGLLSLYRHGQCFLTYKLDTLVIVLEIAVKDILVTLDYITNAPIFWIQGDGVISIDHLAIRLEFFINDGNAYLNSFQVIKLEHYRVRRMTGLSLVFNWLMRIIVNAIAQCTKRCIVFAVEHETKRTLRNLLKNYKLPKL